MLLFHTSHNLQEHLFMLITFITSFYLFNFSYLKVGFRIFNLNGFYSDTFLFFRLMETIILMKNNYFLHVA